MSKTTILGDWVHAHERDSAGAKVFVDSSQTLPPSRGRQRLTFRADGTFVEGQPGADDRTVQATGTYEFDGATLVMHRPGGAEPLKYEAVRGSDRTSLHLKAVRN